MRDKPKVKLISEVRNSLECVDMQIKDSYDLERLSEHTLEEFDLVTMYFDNKDSFANALFNNNMIEDKSADLFLADKYNYKGEHYRINGLIYKNDLSSNLEIVAKERLFGLDIDIANTNVIIGNFIRLCYSPDFYNLIVQSDDFKNTIITCINAKDFIRLRKMTVNNYRLLREMVYLIDIYYKFKDDTKDIYFVATKYSNIVNKRKENMSQIKEIINYNPGGKQLVLSDYKKFNSENN